MTSKAEEEYFFKEEVQKLKKLAEERSAEVADEESVRRKELHHMHCPKCGADLHTVRYGEIDIDRCFGCNGLWLDDGELEKIVERDREDNHHGLLARIFGGFR